MPFDTALTRGIDAMGAPTKKQKLEANTPLKHFLRPLMEEAMLKRKALMEQQQQMPTGNPLQGALMNKGEML
jgi:hypothetical protein